MTPAIAPCSACESRPSVIVRNGSPLCGPCDCEAARCDECGEGVRHPHEPECSHYREPEARADWYERKEWREEENWREE